MTIMSFLWLHPKTEHKSLTHSYHFQVLLQAIFPEKETVIALNGVTERTSLAINKILQKRQGRIPTFSGYPYKHIY